MEQQDIMALVLNKDEVTWQSIIYDLVRKEGMDPFDIDVSLISHKYIETIRQLKDHDFRLSGKVVLAAAILLKMKSNRLVGEELNELDRLLSEPQMDEDSFFEELAAGPARLSSSDIPQLMPRTPQPRKRKVSIQDLVWALQKALEVKRRRVIRQEPPDGMDAPEKKIDISKLIKGLFSRILAFFGRREDITFSKVVPSQDKQDKIMTLIPLLYLANNRKVDLFQDEAFGEIRIRVLDEKPLSEDYDALEVQNAALNPALSKHA